VGAVLLLMDAAMASKLLATGQQFALGLPGEACQSITGWRSAAADGRYVDKLLAVGL
jgi:hypothetical protein